MSLEELEYWIGKVELSRVMVDDDDEETLEGACLDFIFGYGRREQRFNFIPSVYLEALPPS